MASTTLSAGDIAIIGFNFDNPDGFAFVLLTDIGIGTEIKFTDNGWFGSGEFRSNEGTFVWIADQDYSIGTVIQPSLSNVAFSTSGDQIIAYQGDDNNPNFIYALNSEGNTGEWQSNATNSHTSALPTGLINGATAVALPEIDNAIYTGITSGTQNQLLAAISNPNNWSGSDSTQQTLPSASFTITNGSLTPEDLFISEYVEGSNDNKAIEIFNGTGAAIDLAAEDYILEFYFNGNTSPGTTINLTGTIADGDVFVVADNDADAAILAVADQTNIDNFFNGNDGIVLKKGGADGTILDVIGQVGIDPGSQWGSGLTSTQNNTLRRQSSVITGETNPNDTFDPSIEWEGFAENTFDGLGSHSIDAGDEPIVTIQAIDADAAEAGQNPGIFTIARTGDTSAVLTVEYAIATGIGQATNGTDYTPTLSGMATIEAGESSVDITITPIDDSDFEGDETVTLSLIDTDDYNLGGSNTASVNITDNDIILTPIYDIQGTGHTSPLANQSVATTGVVTAVANNGFYLQDPLGDNNDATSDGIFVFTNSSPNVTVGQSVQVEGDVTEFLPGNDTNNLTITEIINPTITPLSNPLPSVTATVIGNGGRTIPTQVIDNDQLNQFDPTQDGIDFYESLEGMVVQVNDAVAVSTTNRFGEIWLVADNGNNATGINNRGGITISESDFNPEQIQIDDRLFSGNSPTVNVGDSLGDVTGVIGYSFGNFELLPTVAPTVTAGSLSQETTSLVGTENQLTVASYNVLNLDPNDNDGDTDIADGRFDAIANHIVNNLQTPDILALQEVQDNDGSVDSTVVDASLTYQTLIDAIVAAGGPSYEFLDIPPIDDQSGGQPGGNIRVGYLYNPERVDLVDGSAERIEDPNLTDGDAFEDSRNSLAATFQFKGQDVTLVNNHFASKGGSSPLFGAVQPPINGGENQRIEQAEVVNNYVNDILASETDANVIVLGDFNEFQFNSPLETLEGDILTNLTETLPENERYSYIFEGNSQGLDHVLVSDSLGDSAEYDIVHVNTGFSDATSDHDPVVARFNFDVPQDVILGTPESDILIGYSPDETINGQGGNDLILAGSGNDVIFGDEGRDYILAGGGDDVIRGGLDHDFLMGNGGNNTFVLAINEGTDIILDFNQGDYIGLADSLTFGELSISQTWGSTLINVEDETLAILVGTQANILTEANFIVI